MKTKPSEKEKAVKLDLDRILEVYMEISKGKTGFVVRDKAYLKMLKKIEGITAKHCIIWEDGYVIFNQDKSGIWIRELVALNKRAMHRMVSSMETRTKRLVYDRTVVNSVLLDVYRSSDYMIQDKGFSLMMFKPLAADASFKQTYGNKFYLSRLDAV